MTANSRLISLIDANNFYVSCERVFRPDLIGKPVAVLSNNDGCVVSRSQEIKDLGVKMGVPAFQIQHLVKQHNIQLLSSNYGLYADLSARVMSILESFAPSIEIYSIDEAFLDFTDLYPCSKDPIAYLYALHRMQALELLTEDCRQKPGFDLNQFAASQGHFGPALPIHFEAKLCDHLALILQESPLSESQTLSDADGSGFRRLAADVLDTWQLRWWIMGEGDRIEVISPIELRLDIGNMLIKAHGQYLCPG